jgi:hypothetical protein
MLFALPAVGCAFKKVYWDVAVKRQKSMFVPAEDILLPYGATNARSAEHVTHILRRSKAYMARMRALGFYRDIDYGSPARTVDETKQSKDRESGMDDTNDERFTLYEQLVELDIDDPVNTTGQPAQYVLTVIKDSEEIIGVRRNWAEGALPNERDQHFVQYDYVPGLGPYGLGLFHLIGGYAESSTSILRQLVDAGTLANLPGGLKTKGMRVKGEGEPIKPGEFRDVDVGSGTIRDSIMPLPYGEPSVVLAGLLDKIVEEGRRLPGMADLKVSDMSAQSPVGTVLALLERQLKVMSAVQARTHASLKEELTLIKKCIQLNEPGAPYDYEPITGSAEDRAEDYALTTVVPVSDPSAATMTQRLVQYQAVIQLSQTAPQIYNLPLLHRGMLDVLGIKNAEKLVPIEDDIVPYDPVTENMRVLRGEPIKAFAHQDHQSHMAVHMAAMNDPLMMQTIGQNPQAQAMMAAGQAHLAEHAAFMYRAQIEKSLGVTLPPMDEPLPPEIEIALSALMARAGARVLSDSQQQAQAAKAKEQAQDPVLQLQVREQDRKDAETGIKKMLAEAKIAGDSDKIKILEKQLQVSALEKLDKQQLAERKQTADEEFKEEEIEVKAVHVGMMGRAQDQGILQKDREMTLKLLSDLQARNAANKLGESGNE